MYAISIFFASRHVRTCCLHVSMTRHPKLSVERCSIKFRWSTARLSSRCFYISQDNSDIPLIAKSLQFFCEKLSLVDLEHTTVSKTNSITGYFPTILLEFSETQFSKTCRCDYSEMWVFYANLDQSVKIFERSMQQNEVMILSKSSVSSYFLNCLVLFSLFIYLFS